MSANLEPCMDCGHLISKSADWCPKCKSFHPRGVPCRFCGEILKVSASDVLDGSGEKLPKPLPGYRSLDLGNVYHERCYWKVIGDPPPWELVCPDCGTSRGQIKFGDMQWLFSSAWYTKPCPECGGPSPVTESDFGSCSRCGLPLSKLFHEAGTQTYDGKTRLVHKRTCWTQKKEPKDDDDDAMIWYAGCLLAIIIFLMFIFLVVL